MSHYISRTKEAFSSKAAFHNAIKVKGAAAEGEIRYNEDLLPTPPGNIQALNTPAAQLTYLVEGRKWQSWHFFAFYLTMTFSPSSYNLGASLISIGLQWYHCMIAAVIGSAILTIFVILNSRGPTKYFLGFPVYVRAAAGVRGASLYIIVRASVATIYFSTQTYYGGKLMSVLLRAIFGNSYRDLPNHLPKSAGISSRDLLSFFIFWAVSITFCLRSIQSLTSSHRYNTRSCFSILLSFATSLSSKQSTPRSRFLVSWAGLFTLMAVQLGASNIRPKHCSFLVRRWSGQ